MHQRNTEGVPVPQSLYWESFSSTSLYSIIWHPGPRRTRPGSDLQDISIAGNHFVQHRIHKEAEKKPRNQARDDDDRKRLLSVRADTRGKRRRQKPQTSNKRGHHDGSQAQERSLACCRANVLVFKTQFVDVRDQDHGGLDRNAHQREQSERRGDAKRSVGHLESDQSAYRFREYDPKRNSHREFEVSVKRKQNHENDKHGDRANEFHLVLCLKQLAILPAPFESIR